MQFMSNPAAEHADSESAGLLQPCMKSTTGLHAEGARMQLLQSTAAEFSQPGTQKPLQPLRQATSPGSPSGYASSSSSSGSENCAARSSKKRINTYQAQNKPQVDVRGRSSIRKDAARTGLVGTLGGGRRLVKLLEVQHVASFYYEAGNIYDRKKFSEVKERKQRELLTGCLELWERVAEVMSGGDTKDFLKAMFASRSFSRLHKAEIRGKKKRFNSLFLEQQTEAYLKAPQGPNGRTRILTTVCNLLTNAEIQRCFKRPDGRSATIHEISLARQQIAKLGAADLPPPIAPMGWQSPLLEPSAPPSQPPPPTAAAVSRRSLSDPHLVSASLGLGDHPTGSRPAVPLGSNLQPMQPMDTHQVINLTPPIGPAPAMAAMSGGALSRTGGPTQPRKRPRKDSAAPPITNLPAAITIPAPSPLNASSLNWLSPTLGGIDLSLLGASPLAAFGSSDPPGMLQNPVNPFSMSPRTGSDPAASLYKHSFYQAAGPWPGLTVALPGMLPQHGSHDAGHSPRFHALAGEFGSHPLLGGPGENVLELGGAGLLGVGGLHSPVGLDGETSAGFASFLQTPRMMMDESVPGRGRGIARGLALG